MKIFGNDYDVLEKLAEQIKGILEKTPGVAQVEFETEGRTPQLQMTAQTRCAAALQSSGGRSE